MTLQELVDKLNKYPNKDKEVYFFADISTDPEDCYVLTFEDISMSKSNELYINLKEA